MSKPSKNSKNKKAADKKPPSDELELDSKPKASKFFVPEDDEEDNETSNVKPQTDKPTKSKFFNPEDDDEDPEEPEEKPVDPKPSKDSKPKSKFFAGGDDEEEEAPEEEKPKAKEPEKKSKFLGGDDEEETQQQGKSKKGKKKGKKGKKDEDDEEENKSPAKKEEKPVQKAEKKGKSKFLPDDEEEEQEKPEEKPSTKMEEPVQKVDKKPKSKFLPEDEEEEPENPEEKPSAKKEEPVQKVDKKPKSKFLPEDEEEEPEKPVEKPQEKPEEESKKGKKKGKKGKKEKEEEEIEPPKPKEEEPASKKEAKPKSKFIQEEDDEGENPKEEKNEEVKNETPEDKAEQERKEKEREKKKAKKEAQKKKKEEKKDEKVEEKKDDKKPKKLTGAAKIAWEKMQKLKEEEERLKKEEEERLRIEEEERKKAEEAERILREMEEKKRKEKEEKIAQMKEEGTYMTKKQRQKYEQDLMKRKQLEESGLLQQFEKDKAIAEEKKPEKKKFKKVDPVKELEEKLRQKELEKTKGVEVNVGEQQNVAVESKEEEEKGEKVAEDWSQLVGGDKQETSADAKKEEEKKVESKDNKKEDKKAKKSEKKPKEKKAKENEEEVKSSEKQTTQETEEPQKNLIELRSPICCILGHVDTGKTTILDKIRNTNVQEGEAGGITQQIGATFFPASKLQTEIDKLKSFYEIDVSVPGLLIIDTPGHESFSNLRSRGSSLCDIAILVIDLMHGIEKQTMESLELLKMRKTPFIVAVNKIDRVYEWKPYPNESSYISLKKQGKPPVGEFKKRLDGMITELAERGFNAALYWENPDVGSYVSLVPTSGITGEGLPDLLGVILKYSSRFLKQKIKMLGDVFDCTVLEVKMIEGLGTTIDVILVNGTLKEGDKIVLMGFNGPIITTIRALLTPHPMKEMRVKNEYLHHKVIHASMGVKISAVDLETAVAGCHLYVAENDDEIDGYRRELQADFEGVRKKIELVNQGVCVAASTLGSLEALLQFLKTSKIPVAHIGIGPVSKEDVTKSLKSILADDEKKKRKEFATVLAFDVKILPEAQQMADQNGIKIFTANIIYHLFDQFMAYVNEIREERKREEGKDAVFPCVLKTVAFINKKDPLILGVDVVKGVLKIGTPLCLFDQSKLRLGVVENIELNKKPLKEALPATGSVAIRIKGDQNIMAGRHFEMTAKYVSILSRNSLDLLKEYFKDEMTKANWDLVRDLKPFFQIY